jgi:hypothetical protein
MEIKMDSKLQRLIEIARKHKITPAEHDAQVRSFTFGNTHLENASITREDVSKTVDSLKGVEFSWEVTKQS